MLHFGWVISSTIGWAVNKQHHRPDNKHCYRLDRLQTAQNVGRTISIATGWVTISSAVGWLNNKYWTISSTTG